MGQASLERRQTSPLRLPTDCLRCQTDFVFNKYLNQEENLKACGHHGEGSNYPVAQVRRRKNVWEKVSTCDTIFLKGMVGSVWHGRSASQIPSHLKPSYYFLHLTLQRPSCCALQWHNKADGEKCASSLQLCYQYLCSTVNNRETELACQCSQLPSLSLNTQPDI